jgi:hypothetical protein
VTLLKVLRLLMTLVKLFMPFAADPATVLTMFPSP